MFEKSLIQLVDIESITESDYQTNLVDIEVEEDNSFCLSSGIVSHNSAASSILSARSNNMGCYPLKGKPINALAATTKELMDNKEFTEMMTILGLKIGEKVTSTSQLRFGKIVMCADADHDGASIVGLILATIKKFWPELFLLGTMYRFKTPIMKTMIGKEEEFFDTLEEFETWAEKQKKPFKTRYLKGLGSSTAGDFRSYFDSMNTRLVKITIDSISDLDVIDKIYGKEAGLADWRKTWLDLE